MKLAMVVFLAYALTGIFFLWRDLSERNPIKWVGYTTQYRRTGNAGILLLHGATWPLAICISVFFKRQIDKMGREGLVLGFFFLVAALIWIISN